MNLLEARRNIHLYDCCSNKVSARAEVSEEGQKFVRKVSTKEVDKKLAKALFVDGKGAVVIASCQEGKSSLCTGRSGGVFTASLLEVIGKNGGERLGDYNVGDVWSKVFRAASRETMKKDSRQEPQAFYLSDIVRHDSYVEIANKTSEEVTLRYRFINYSSVAKLKDQEWRTVKLAPNDSTFLALVDENKSPVYEFEYVATGKKTEKVWKETKGIIHDPVTGYAGFGYNAGPDGSRLRTHSIELQGEE